MKTVKIYFKVNLWGCDGGPKYWASKLFNSTWFFLHCPKKNLIGRAVNRVNSFKYYRAPVFYYGCESICRFTGYMAGEVEVEKWIRLPLGFRLRHHFGPGHYITLERRAQ